MPAKKKELSQLGNLARKNIHLGVDFDFLKHVLPIFSWHIQIQFSENGGFYS